MWSAKKAVLTIHILIVSISDGKIQLWAFLAETPKGTDNSAPWLLYWKLNYGWRW